MRRELQSGWDCAFIRMHRAKWECVERGAGRAEIMVYRKSDRGSIRNKDIYALET